MSAAPDQQEYLQAKHEAMRRHRIERGQIHGRGRQMCPYCGGMVKLQRWNFVREGSRIVVCRACAEIINPGLCEKVKAEGGTHGQS